MVPPQKVFPSTYWDPTFHTYLGLIDFLERAPWKNLVAPFPADNTPQSAQELEMLLTMQGDPERGKRTPEIEAEHRAPPVAFQRLLLFTERSHPKTHELAFSAMILVGRCVVMYYKNLFNRARPSQREPRLRPLLDVPGHPAYPSGHSTQMHLVAHALGEVVQDDAVKPELFNIAWRVAENREWAGIHYRSDSEAGRDLAAALFPYVKTSFSATFEQARLEWSC